MEKSPWNRVVLALAACAAAATSARGASADDVHIGPNDVGQVFVVSKSENKNQVSYGIRLDERCMPVGPQPMFAFWKLYEDGPNAVADLLGVEQPAYGIAIQEVLAPNGASGRVRVTLRAIATRPIVVETSRVLGRCVATATLDVAGTRAKLAGVFAQLKWPIGVAYLDLIGNALSDGHVVKERIDN
jgi:hypothetical protein